MRTLQSFTSAVSCLIVMLVSSAGCAAEPAARAAAVLRVPRDHATVQAAIDAAADGDTVLVAPGVYQGGFVIDGKAITLASQFLTTGRRELVAETILEIGEKDKQVLRLGKGAAGTRVIGLTLRNGSDGILCYADRVEVLDNRILRCGDGIDYEGGGGVCRGNLFENNRDDAVDLDGDCAVVVEDNVIRQCGDDGLEIRFYEYKGDKPLKIVIRGNVIDRSGEDGIQFIDHDGPSNRDVVIERNVISNSRKAAVAFMDKEATREDYRGAQVPDPVLMINNTLLNNHYGLVGGGNVIAANNVFAGTEKTAAWKTAGRSLLTRNLFWKNGVDIADCETARDSTTGVDPKLDADGRPAGDGPCIDAGLAELTWKDDLVFKLEAGRFAGAAPDLGAWEKDGPGPATQPDTD